MNRGSNDYRSGKLNGFRRERARGVLAIQSLHSKLCKELSSGVSSSLLNSFYLSFQPNCPSIPVCTR